MGKAFALNHLLYQTLYFRARIKTSKQIPS